MQKRTIAGLMTAAAIAVAVIGTTAYAETPPPSSKPSTPPSAPASGTPASPDTEQEDPSGSGTVEPPKGSGIDNEAADAAALTALAKVSETDAKNAALAKFPGATVTTATLGDENGTVVWEIQLTDASKVAHDVKVDAGTGAILATEAGAANSEQSGGAED